MKNYVDSKKKKRTSLVQNVQIFYYYLIFPKSPLIISVDPERITEERALLAALFAMVLLLDFVPPRTELIILVEMDLATEDAAFVAAF